MRVEEQVALGPKTTFGVGGAARYFATAESEADVSEGVRWAEDRGLRVFVLGGGSNLLVPDTGFEGLVLQIGIRGIAREGGSFEVGAGESWDGFVDAAIAAGCAGVECMAGIPGSVGGTPVQNVGAYGQEVAETISWVEAFDRVARKLVRLSNAECAFRYRGSRFNLDEPGRYVVTRVRFELREGGPATLKYAELARRLAVSTFARDGAAGEDGPPGRLGLAEVAAAVREIRHGKGMLIVPGEADCRSAGSFFKNPILPMEILGPVAEAAGVEVASVPHWDAGERVKLSAAWLMEKAGFVKGYGAGPVGVSSRHTLALCNRGGARFADVVAMQAEVVDGVRRKFGVELEREPVVLG